MDLSSRTQVRSVECPYCGAGVAEKCVGARVKAREANHQERVNAYRKVWNEGIQS